MRILHTSDWHLGKRLEDFERFEEQESFINELSELCDKESIDIVLLAGDVYDTYTPPSYAQELFSRAIKLITQDGKRPFIIIAGNHDSPERLSSISSLAVEFGAFIFGKLEDCFSPKKYDSFEVLFTKPNFLKIQIKNETINIATLPYPGESRINMGDTAQTYLNQEEYSHIIKNISEGLCSYFDNKSINIFMSHLFVSGAFTSDSERDISLGGTYVLNPSDLPAQADYIALGHLHRAQKVFSAQNAFYSGSPLQYSRSESNNAKSVNIIDIFPSGKAQVKPILLKCIKPVEITICNGIEQAVDYYMKNSGRKFWSYLDITLKEPLSSSDIQLIKSQKKDIVSICPFFEDSAQSSLTQRDIHEYSPQELFIKFYEHTEGHVPSKELTELFTKVFYEEGQEDETPKTDL
jgi:exonuclease SbcD